MAGIAAAAIKQKMRSGCTINSTVNSMSLADALKSIEKSTD
jgi:hypothetical protein